MADDLLAVGINIVTGIGEAGRRHLVNRSSIDLVSMTGDVAIGRRVIEAATACPKRIQLEMGGKAPVVVFDDADLNEVVEGLRAFGYYNARHDCTAA